ncbi:MAG: hypothetical protein ACLQBQ_13885 [Smithella sp.]
MAFVLVVNVVYAQAPVRNVSPRLHPNLAEAQELCFQAYQKIEAAQKANNGDMGGHALRAKELLEQVNSELKLAAEAANVNRGK